MQGGAYGTGLSVNDSGFVGCYSFRDPDAARSLMSFEKCGGFLRDFVTHTQDLTGFIIGAVSDDSPLLTPRMKGMVEDSFYWKKISREERCERRRQLLEASPEVIHALAGPIEQAITTGGSCVVGGKKTAGGLRKFGFHRRTIM